MKTKTNPGNLINLNRKNLREKSSKQTKREVYEWDRENNRRNIEGYGVVAEDKRKKKFMIANVIYGGGKLKKKQNLTSQTHPQYTYTANTWKILPRDLCGQ